MQRSQNIQGNFEKNKKAKQSGKMLLPYFKTYYNAIVIKQGTIKGGHINQWNRIRSPEIGPYIQSQLILDNPIKINQWGKDCL